MRAFKSSPSTDQSWQPRHSVASEHRRRPARGQPRTDPCHSPRSGRQQCSERRPSSCRRRPPGRRRRARAEQLRPLPTRCCEANLGQEAKVRCRNHSRHFHLVRPGDRTDPCHSPRSGRQQCSEHGQVLAAAGLRVGTVEREPNDAAAADTVLRSQPGAGTKVDAGTTVDIFASSGRASCVVPDVVNKPAENALAMIKSVCASTGSTKEVLSDAVPKDAVISTDPSSGATITKGGAIQLVVSKGGVVAERGRQVRKRCRTNAHECSTRCCSR